MILEEATFEAFGYYSTDWALHSHKPILAACELCGEFRITSNDQYYTFCHFCATKGRKHTDEEKCKQSEAQKGSKCALGYKHTKEQNRQHSEAMKGNKYALGFKHTEGWKRENSERMKGNKHGHGNKGKTATEEAKRNMRLNQPDQRGDRNPNYNGGKEEAERRHYSKKQQLGYVLISPIKVDEVGHHITNEYVIGILADVHQRFSGHDRETHRALVLQWLKDNDYQKYKLALKVL